jgi:hypothetical protein
MVINKDWTDVLLYFVPAFLVLGAMYLVIKKFLERDQQVRIMEIKRNMQKEALPLKLQAIERMVLFMERISPDNLLPRMHRTGITSGQLHSDLLATIRSEYEHNITQQIYLSDSAWDAVKNAKEELIKIINLALEETGSQVTAVHLSSKIFDIMITNDSFPHQTAIEKLKKEGRMLIG